MKNKKNLTKRREFLKKAGLISAGAIGASTLAAPYGYAATNPIKWRLQTYSGAPLGAHVVLPQIEAFNKAAHGEMEIELFYADQLVPTDELFRAMQAGTIDAVQSDDATMGSPVDISVFGGYFPFATRYSLDVPAMFKYYGGKVKNIPIIDRTRKKGASKFNFNNRFWVGIIDLLKVLYYLKFKRSNK